MNHEITISGESYRAIRTGQKKFEMVQKDRDYKVGDVVVFNETDNMNNATGNRLSVTLTYITDNDQVPNQVVLGFESFYQVPNNQPNPYQQQPYQQQPYQGGGQYQAGGQYQQNGAPYSGKPDSRSFGFALLSFFFPIVGLILWIVWRQETPQKAKSCGIGAIVGTAVNILIYVLYFIFIIVVGISASSTELMYDMI